MMEKICPILKTPPLPNSVNPQPLPNSPNLIGRSSMTPHPNLGHPSHPQLAGNLLVKDLPRRQAGLPVHPHLPVRLLSS